MSSAERKKSLLDSLERSRNNTSNEGNDGVRRRKAETDRKSKRSPDSDLLNIQALSRMRHSFSTFNTTSDEVNSSLEYTEVNNRPDLLDSLTRLQKIVLSESRRRSTESADSEGESSIPKKHSRRNWGDSDSESEEVRSLVRRSSSQLEAAEALMARQDACPALDCVRIETDFSSGTSIAMCMAKTLCVRRHACLRARTYLVALLIIVLILSSLMLL